MDWELELREEIFKHRNEANHVLSAREDEMTDREFLAAMLSAVMNAVEGGLVVLTRQIESHRRTNAEDE